MKVRLIALVLLLAMVAACFVGCNSGKDGGATTEKPTTPSVDKLPAGSIALVEKNATKYQIVYYSKGGETVRAAAEELSGAIAATTGVEIPVTADLGTDALKESEYEIRIGKVSRMDALSVWTSYNHLSERDFAIEVHGNHVYIYGTTALSITTALSYFQEKVLYLTSAAAGVKEDFSLLYIEEAVESVAFTGADENYAYFSINPGQFSEAFLRISFSDNNGWRLQTKNNATEPFNDFGASQRLAYSLGEEMPLNVYPITATEEDGIVTIREEGGTHVTVNVEEFVLNVYNAKGECSATITNISSNLGGCLIEGKMNPNEAIYGTGERFNAVNQRGQKINMFTKDEWSKATACYMVIPLLCFSRGSGVFLNIYEEMDLDLGKMVKKSQEDTWSASVYGTTLDCYIFATEQMSEAIQGYTDLSGHATQPEEWTYGMLICRYGPDLSQKWTTSITPGETSDGRGMGVYDVIAYYEKYDLPWTGVLAEGWGAYTGKKYDDLEELCDYVHSLGKKFLVYMRVGLANANMTGFTEDYLVEMIRPNGTTTTNLPAAETNNPDTAGATDRAYPYLDITSPEACEWFFNEVWYKLSVEIGVDGCKIDFCETLPEYYELNYYDDSMPTSGSHHWYPSAFCAKFFEMIASKPDSGMCYTRGGGIGAQRAPYMWAGDQARKWDSIGWQLTSVLSSGMSGVPFMSYDMSGYQYGDAPKTTIGGFTVLDPQYEAKVFVRGLQFTAFTICMQQHGKVRQAFEFSEGDIHMAAIYRTSDGKYTTTIGKNTFVRWCKATTGGLDTSTGYYKGIDPATGNLQEGSPYKYVYEIQPGSMSYVTDIYRAYCKLHELLTPYITELTAEACETGMPVARILALQWQDDVNVYDIQDQYMFGDAFMIAPVLTDAYSRNIYLPEGEWVDLMTGEEYTVGKDGMWLNDYQVSLADLPVFYNKNTTSATAAELLPGIQEIFDYLDTIALPVA
ncbi:MAG: glycoside hydrolase family 31 protein [Clostridia bacterium]|nr:glycoside hydrolase family 31 protein [Clostridia bacterium]